MKATRLSKSASVLVGLIASAACSSSSGSPSAAALNDTYVGKILFVNGRPVTAARLSPLPRYATIAPDHHTKKTFEYVFNEYETYASIFDYPKSTRQIGSIYGDGGQGCTNVFYGYGKKTFWNVGGPTPDHRVRGPTTRRSRR